MPANERRHGGHPVASDRREATRALEADRVIAAWQAAMTTLDAEEPETRATLVSRPHPGEIADTLADMAGLYADATPQTQHRILQALFERIEVLRPNEVWLYPSLEAEARGWAAAMSGEFRMELRKTGRGERNSAVMSDAGAVVRFGRPGSTCSRSLR
jgi:hypothetical protein